VNPSKFSRELIKRIANYPLIKPWDLSPVCYRSRKPLLPLIKAMIQIIARRVKYQNLTFKREDDVMIHVMIDQVADHHCRWH
jgi:hypothetical protein